MEWNRSSNFALYVSTVTYVICDWTACIKILAIFFCFRSIQMFLLSTKKITHFDTVSHTQLERSITRVVVVLFHNEHWSRSLSQWWWSDECCDDQMNACEQLTCEQSPMAVDGPLHAGGEIVFPTPTIIWWSWSCSRWWLWSLSQWWSCGWAALLWQPVIIIIVLFGKRPHLSTFLCTLLIMIRIFMITTIKLIKTMLITWMEGRRRELYSQKRHHEVSVSYFPTLSTRKCVSPLCRFKFLL